MGATPRTPRALATSRKHDSHLSQQHSDQPDEARSCGKRDRERRVRLGRHPGTFDQRALNSDNERNDQVTDRKARWYPAPQDVPRSMRSPATWREAEPPASHRVA